MTGLEQIIARLRREQPDNELAMALCQSAEDLMLAKIQVDDDMRAEQFVKHYGIAPFPKDYSV